MSEGSSTAARTPDEPWLAALLRTLIYGLSGLLALYPMTSPRAVLAGGLGAACGALLGRRLARGRLRDPALWGVSSVGLLLSLWLRAGVRGSTWVAGELGPAGSVELAAVLLASLGGLWLAAALRATALRHPAVRALEVALVAFAFAAPFVAHRGGHINRPFEIADSILAEGGDPAMIFRAAGAVAGAVAVVLLFASRSLTRTALHLGLAALLLPLLVLSSAELSVPNMDDDPLGLRGGKGKKAREQDAKQGKGQGKPRDDDRHDNEQLRFRDQPDQPGRQVPLAVVLLHDDYSPPSGMYYFRQAAFSQYNGQRLIASSRADVDRDTLPAFVGGKTAVDAPPGPDGRVTLDTTVAMLADHARPFALESPVSVEPMANPDPGRFRRVYRVTSAALELDYGSLVGATVGDPDWDAAQRAHYLRGPDDPRYAALAEEIAGGLEPLLADDGVARALTVALWLGKEGTYSLKSGHSGTVDPTGDFLFGDRIGYCVHFAHAAVYLMRALGVPARIGTGYAIEEAARQGGSAILLTGANAHAWPELYIHGVGWVVMDVAPQQALDAAPAPPDADLQRLLGEMARGLRPLPASEHAPLQPALRAARRLWVQLRWAVAVGVPLCLLLLYLTKLWRRWSPLVAGAERLPRLAYRAELDRLSDLSMRRGFGESRERFAERIAGRAPSFAALTQRHVADRYGGERGMSRAEYRRLAGALRRERAAAAPLWRRLFGWLSPWSFLQSR